MPPTVASKPPKKPKGTASLPLGKEGKAKQKSIDDKNVVLFGTPDRKVVQLAGVYVDAIESKQDASTHLKEAKAALHKQLESLRVKGKLCWIRKQSERGRYKFSATAKFELKTEKES